MWHSGTVCPHDNSSPSLPLLLIVLFLAFPPLPRFSLGNIYEHNRLGATARQQLEYSSSTVMTAISVKGLFLCSNLFPSAKIVQEAYKKILLVSATGCNTSDVYNRMLCFAFYSATMRIDKV